MHEIKRLLLRMIKMEMRSLSLLSLKMGFLSVRKENQVLQQFLHYHPENGATFVEVNLEKDASQELEVIHHEVDALIAAREMDIARAEQIARVGIGMNTDKMTSAEIKRDVLVYARKKS